MKTHPILIAFALLSLAPLAAEDAPPSGVHLENAVVVPHGDTINCYSVPVATKDGIKLYDLDLHLTVADDGTIKADAVKSTPAALPDTVMHFVPGEYVAVTGDKRTLTITGPVIGTGGAQVWTFIGTNGFGPNGYGGTWGVGPRELNPALHGIPAETKLPKNYAYGLTAQHVLVGVQQLGDKLMLSDVVEGPDSYSIGKGAIYQRKPGGPSN